MSKAVHDMFSSIAKSYDLANDILSFGIHRSWRKKSLKFAQVPKGLPISSLDVCCGTGDFSREIRSLTHSTSTVVGLDFVYNMLRIAEEKKEFAPITFIQGDALNLPFKDESFDLCTVSFGIRNVDNVLSGLSEMKRVLKKGGKIIVLEFGKPHNPLVYGPFLFYSKYIMPLLGKLISGHSTAYEYLPTTSAAFPTKENFIGLMDEAGLQENRWHSFFGGIAYCYIGRK